MESRRDKKMACCPANKRIGHLSRKAARKEQKCIALSGANFHRTIMEKYQMSKSNPFKFPMMIFLKNRRSISRSKNNIDILLNLHLHHFNLVSSSISKSIKNIQQLFSEFTSEKFLPRLAIEPDVIQRNISMLSRFSLRTKLYSFRAERGATPILLKWYQLGSSQLQEMRKKAIDQVIKRHSFTQKESEKKYLPLLRRNLPLIPSIFNLFPKGTFDETSPNRTTTYKIFARDHKRAKFAGHFPYASFIPARAGIQSVLLHKAPMDSGFRSGSPGMTGWRKPSCDHKQIFINHVHRGPKTTDAVSPPIQRTAATNTSLENFSFRRPRQTEQKIEEIKKIALETKKALSEKSLARRIRMERERRGL
jgi:hypothetical protein